MSFKDQMIEAVERGYATDDTAYEYVRESLADAADLRRKADRDNGVAGRRNPPGAHGPDASVGPSPSVALPPTEDQTVPIFNEEER